MASTSRIILVVTGIFLAGAVTGGFVSLRVAPLFARKPGGPDRFGLQVDRLNEQLNLTPAQVEKIRPIAERANDEFRKARKESFRVAAALFEQADAEIAQELTPAQLKHLGELRAQENERRKQRINDRPKREGARPPASPEGVPPADSPPAPVAGSHP